MGTHHGQGDFERKEFIWAFVSGELEPVVVGSLAAGMATDAESWALASFIAWPEQKVNCRGVRLFISEPTLSDTLSPAWCAA